MDVSAMFSVLNDYGFTDTGTARKLEAIQWAIHDIESRHPWPFLETSSTLTFDGSSENPTNFPADFRASIRLTNLGTGRRILPIRLEALEDNVAGKYTETGEALFYYFEGSQMKIWRVPSSSTTMKLRYLQVSDDITSDTLGSQILIPKRHHKAIVLGALVDLYDMEDDPELALRFEGHYEQRIERMVADVFQRQFDRPDHILITDPDDLDFELL